MVGVRVSVTVRVRVALRDGDAKEDRGRRGTPARVSE